jgi:hypothetical protein
MAIVVQTFKPGLLEHDFATLLVSPTHKRTGGRAPVWGSEFTSKNAAWGSEFTSKNAALQGGYSRNRCWTERTIVDFGA